MFLSVAEVSPAASYFRIVVCVAPSKASPRNPPSRPVIVGVVAAHGFCGICVRPLWFRARVRPCSKRAKFRQTVSFSFRPFWIPPLPRKKRATAGETSPSRHARGDRDVSAAEAGDQQGSRLAGVVNTASRWPSDGAKLIDRRLLSYRCGEVTIASRGSSVSLYASQLTWDGQRSLKINVADAYKVPDASSSCSRARASLH